MVKINSGKKTIAIVGTYSTTVTDEMRSQLKTATDYTSLASGSLDELAWAVSVGLIKGVSASSLTINPTSSIKRDEVSMMSMRYYSGLKK